ncbi:MAG: hypothetical protein ACJ8BW_13860, partial [Ktedonobacteraceae bacterium]
ILLLPDNWEVIVCYAFSASSQSFHRFNSKSRAIVVSGTSTGTSKKEALAIASSRVQRNWEKEPSLTRELAPFGVSLPSLSKLGNAL